MSTDGPNRIACPACGHPLILEVWTRADTATGRMVEEVVVVNPVVRAPVQRCPGCGRPLHDLARR